MSSLSRNLIAAICLALTVGANSAFAIETECVILLHGLARSASSMNKIEERLHAEGYLVANIDYPSTESKIEVLAPAAVKEGLALCARGSAKKIHFVTHSMGGILVRQYLAIHDIPTLGRTVMISPPNNGSAVVDHLKGMAGYELLNGPAGLQLGTGGDSVPRKLGPVDFPVGVITGDRTVNPVLSQYLENPDDGKVSARSAMVEGAVDFRIVHRTHTFIMRADEVLDDVVHFLKNGAFQKPAQGQS